eukprot:249886-Amorphochlora_amoeboformis.AAC.2
MVRIDLACLITTTMCSRWGVGHEHRERGFVSYLDRGRGTDSRPGWEGSLGKKFWKEEDRDTWPKRFSRTSLPIRQRDDVKISISLIVSKMSISPL